MIDGHRFASKAEAKRYGELKMLEKAGEIESLEVHPRLDLEINGRTLGRGYIELDFFYIDWGRRGAEGDPTTVYEDVKSVDTRESKFRREVAEAIHGITINVVKG